jgi:chemotaxis protein histidine kinase CheA
MGVINISDYKELYLKTAKDYFDSLSKSCSELAKNFSDHDALIQLHISSHSLRSQSEAMSYLGMSSITGAIEKIARAVLEGKYNINTDIISVLKEAITEINVLLSDIEKINKEKNVDSIVRKLDEVSKI